MSRLLDLREAKNELGVGHKWLYNRAAEGLIHPVQVGGKGRIYYPEWEIRALVEAEKSVHTATKAEQLELELTA